MTDWRCPCVFCVELARLAIRRRAPVLAAEAIRLRDVHAANDAERARFATQPRGGRLPRTAFTRP